MSDGQKNALHPFFAQSGVICGQSHSRDKSKAGSGPKADGYRPHTHQPSSGSMDGAVALNSMPYDVQGLDGTSEHNAGTEKHQSELRINERADGGGEKPDRTTVQTMVHDQTEQRQPSVRDGGGSFRHKRQKISDDEARDTGREIAGSPSCANGIRHNQFSMPVTAGNHLLSQSTSPIAAEIYSAGLDNASLLQQESSDQKTSGMDFSPTTGLSALTSNTGSQSYPSSTPKKMLKLTGSGRLISPVLKPIGGLEIPIKQGARRGRKKREVKRLVVVLDYAKFGSPQAVGARIDRILCGSEKVCRRNEMPVKTVQEQKGRVSKSTHPFFLAKPADDKVGSESKASKSKDSASKLDVGSPVRKSSAATPGKIRAEVQSLRALRDTRDTSSPERLLLDTRNSTKNVRGDEAVWPRKDSMHVRGFASGHQSRQPLSDMGMGLQRKMKNKPLTIEPAENLLNRFRDNLDFKQKQHVRTDGFEDPNPALRIPSRHLLSGVDIQSRVIMALNDAPTHPALRSMYEAIATELTPYDSGRGEPLTWTNKYAPKCAEHVLQTGKEASILRNWMTALAVKAVEGPGLQVNKADLDALDRKPRKKRRKKAEDLEGFIVSSDEEPMDELLAPESMTAVSTGVGGAMRTVIRGGNTGDETYLDPRKTANALLISGTHGCGKTAMVQAVAKELNFEIFEINAGSRRSGRDVLERVGDMVGNHLVRHHGAAADAGNTSADEDISRVSKAFNKDLESGRQGTMNSFFIAKPARAPVAPKKPKPKPMPKAEQVQELSKALARPRQAREQKQSLILLEEVDILFDEDKNFWTTVLTLIANSKRPVIMTCNDESSIPFQAMKLHAIMRLTPPPMSLATDYLLLLAAREGHLIARDAVSALLELRHHDLRSTMANLQFWCQMGVGDPRGGLSWIYQRWPPEKGVDEQGRSLRVTSQGALYADMGSLAGELEPTAASSCEEELLKEAWAEWAIDPREELHTNIGERTFCHDYEGASPQDHLTSLKQFEQLSDGLSAMDIYTSTSLPSSHIQRLPAGSISPPLGSVSRQIVLDPTQPECRDKVRPQYIDGLPLLQADEAYDYEDFDTKIAVSTCHLINRVYSQPNKPLVYTEKADLVRLIRDRRRNGSSPPNLLPQNFSAAFDPISEPQVSSLTVTSGMVYSVFDGTLPTIVTDIAPYVRSIVQYDLALEEQRLRLNHFLSGSQGSQGKRGRTTRAARSALEGGKRETTRKERWFPDKLDMQLVLDTGGRGWPNTGLHSLGSVGEVSRDASHDVSRRGSGASMEL